MKTLSVLFVGMFILGCSPHSVSPPEAASGSPADAAVATPGRLEEAMSEPAVIEFVGTPIAMVAEYLESAHKVRITFDLESMARVGADRTTPVTCQIRGHTLQEGLHMMLSALNLSYAIREGEIVITAASEGSQTGDAQRRGAGK